MLQQEFEARVKIHVSYKEYEVISEVYNNSDLNKDEFCREWVRMNQKRVNQAIAEEKERQRLSAIKDKAWDNHPSPLQLRQAAAAGIADTLRKTDGFLQECWYQDKGCGEQSVSLYHVGNGDIQITEICGCSIGRANYERGKRNDRAGTA